MERPQRPDLGGGDCWGLLMGADGMRLSAQVHLHVGVAVWDADRMGGTW